MAPQIKTFYSYFRSSTAYRLRIALALKGVTPQETCYVNLLKGEQHSEEYRQVNPAAAVPAFELEDGTVLTQSLAMLEWLEEVYPQPALLPVDNILRARVRAFADVVATDMHPVNNLRILHYLTNELNVPEEAKMQWMHHWMRKGFAVLESMIAAEKGKFCFGDTPTLADICLVPQIYNALRFEVKMTTYPRLMAVYSHASQHPAFAQAAPELQPDCPAPT